LSISAPEGIRLEKWRIWTRIVAIPHSIATQLLDAGAPLHKVSSFLGHSDPKITVKSYYSESEGLNVEDFIDIE